MVTNNTVCHYQLISETHIRLNIYHSYFNLVAWQKQSLCPSASQGKAVYYFTLFRIYVRVFPRSLGFCVPLIFFSPSDTTLLLLLLCFSRENLNVLQLVYTVFSVDLFYCHMCSHLLHVFLDVHVYACILCLSVFIYLYEAKKVKSKITKNHTAEKKRITHLSVELTLMYAHAPQMSHPITQKNYTSPT